MAEGRRGALRSETARVSILRATASQFAERGWEHLSIEGIAAEAEVGKQTIYRWWRSKAALVAECLLEGLLLPEAFLPADTGDVRADLTAWIEAILRFADDPRSAALFRSLIAAAAEDEDVGVRLRDALGASSALAARLDAARSDGELAPGVSIAVVGEALVGAIILRVIVREAAPPELPRQLVDVVLGRGG